MTGLHGIRGSPEGEHANAEVPPTRRIFERALAHGSPFNVPERCVYHKLQIVSLGMVSCLWSRNTTVGVILQSKIQQSAFNENIY